jgi:rfaE bifunctional protein nucleotidyltransferase chain/domain
MQARHKAKNLRNAILVGRRCVYWKGLVFSYRPEIRPKAFRRDQGTRYERGSMMASAKIANTTAHNQINSKRVLKMREKNSKIRTQKEIQIICKEIRKKRPSLRIVTTNGSFDILHSAHIDSLKKAKTYGDILIVGLNSDSSIKKYKSPSRPIIPQKERAELLSALEIVNYVVIFNQPEIGVPLINLVKPDYHVKSRSGYMGFEEAAIRKHTGKLILLKDIPGLSTTKIIQKIKGLKDE